MTEFTAMAMAMAAMVMMMVMVVVMQMVMWLVVVAVSRSCKRSSSARRTTTLGLLSTCGQHTIDRARSQPQPPPTVALE